MRIKKNIRWRTTTVRDLEEIKERNLSCLKENAQTVLEAEKRFVVPHVNNPIEIRGSLVKNETAAEDLHSCAAR